ncbi:hypothetical protein BDV29DRAFT_160357 [Aspergillus leporis]|uniref:Transcription factor domain-containing protein n=1 Tax=Aspergillus leporis TaxID=41062 RepID=A0A5N5WTV2_9EURO|nr:hypothetical protein BDV29DRAFT_160357 [Aspergillus leporis]
MSALECADLDDFLAPVINQQRYYARGNQDSEADERFTCLHYAMRALAASMGSQSRGYCHFCTHTRLLHIGLLGTEHAERGSSHQAGSGTAAPVYLVKLDQIDNPNSWQTSKLSWVEMEERRRKYWAADELDCYANLVNGLPMRRAWCTSVFQDGHVRSFALVGPAVDLKL